VSNESRATKWLRRFLAYIGAIMRHLYVLIGSAALTIITSGPSWVASELPRVWQERIEAWWLFPPLTHWLTWSIPAAGIFIASFLAWNEDRDLLESKNVALAKLQDDRPRFGTSEIRRVSFQADQERGPDWLKIFIFVTLRNLGGESSVEGWEVHLKGQKLDALMNETGLSPSRNEDSISSHEGGNLLHDTTAVQKNRHHYGWLLWNTRKERVGGLTTGEESKVFVTVSFRDVKGNSYTLPPFRG